KLAAEPIRLTPQDKLVSIVRRSQELALEGEGGEADEGDKESCLSFWKSSTCSALPWPHRVRPASLRNGHRSRTACSPLSLPPGAHVASGLKSGVPSSGWRRSPCLKSQQARDLPVRRPPYSFRRMIRQPVVSVTAPSCPLFVDDNRGVFP